MNVLKLFDCLNACYFQSYCSDSEDDEKVRKEHKKDSLDREMLDAFGDFSFLKSEKTDVIEKQPKRSGEWSINQRAIDQMKEKFR